MSWADLIRPLPKPARKAATGIGLERRLRIALEPPPPLTVYGTPSFRRLDAALFAARGYFVHWCALPADDSADQYSVLTYAALAPDGRMIEVELPTIVPGRVSAAAARLKGRLLTIIERI